MKTILLIISIILFLTCLSISSIVNVPGDTSSIQGGIFMANPGDTVLVDHGTYYENINFRGKSMTVTSRFVQDEDSVHIDSTIINGSQPVHSDSGSVVFFVSGEDSTSVLMGFTITAGRGSRMSDAFGTYRTGGGIFINESGAKIVSNKIISNHVDTVHPDQSWGAGIQAVGGIGDFIIIKDNLIYNNQANSTRYSFAGGVSLGTKEYIRFSGNIVENNLADGGEIAFAAGMYVWGGDWGEGPFDGKIIIMGNRISGNKTVLRGSTVGSINDGGGGLLVEYSNPEIVNNVISNNWATYGGGFYIESARPVLINNTIVGNQAEYGAGIASIGSQAFPKLFNSIIWGNSASTSGSAVFKPNGSILIRYSNVQDGWLGEGNFNQDPVFNDTIYYYLNSASPCIDAGHPDPLFNDREDPNSPGNPLWPAMGSLRNDMGSHGGNPSMMLPDSMFLYGTQFTAFLERIYSLPQNQRQAVSDSFMNTIPAFPLVEDSIWAYFVYRGSGAKITVPGDANGWNMDAFPMTKIPGTNFWYYATTFETDARLDYKFVLDDINWILDPLNPNQVSGGYGPNSELAMPTYIQPEEIEYCHYCPRGTLEDTLFFSNTLGNSRNIKVYLPPNYEQAINDSFPIMLFHDGQEWIDLGFARNIFDWLIFNERIEPLIGIFVPPKDRNNEYAFNLTTEYSGFIIDELMPFIDANYRTRRDPAYRAMTGVSFGGLISTQICYNHPEVFGLCAPQSPAYWPENMVVFDAVINGPKKDIKFYMDWGTYETSIMLDGRVLSQNMEMKGYHMEWREWHEGHSWGSWRAHLDIALEYFFPKELPLDDIAVSTFDTNDEGWTVSGDAQGSSVIPDYVTSGGNPGGYVSALDNVAGGVWYWKAPAKFLGDVSSAYGQIFSFDLRQSSTASQFDAADVILEGSGLKLVYDTPNNPGTDWTSYEITLQETAGWKVGTLDGLSATAGQMDTVLSALTDLFIRGEYVTGSDRGDLDNVVLRGVVTGIEDELVTDQIVREFILYQNYPNPFNPSTSIEFYLPKSSQVTLTIFNILGEKVTTLLLGKLPAGKHRYIWDTSKHGGIASGMYLYRLKSGEFIETRKMVLMK